MYGKKGFEGTPPSDQAGLWIPRHPSQNLRGGREYDGTGNVCCFFLRVAPE